MHYISFLHISYCHTNFQLGYAALLVLGLVFSEKNEGIKEKFVMVKESTTLEDGQIKHPEDYHKNHFVHARVTEPDEWGTSV